jgi:putative transposase
MNLEPEEHHRRSIRLKGYDYSVAGGYYATVVAFRRECLFGEIVNREMRLNALGRIVREEWFRSAEIRKEIRIEEDEFIVMPNHIHGIIWIYDVGADGVRPDGGVRPDTGQSIIKPTRFNARGVSHARGASLAPLQRPPRSLGSFIAGFKASVTSRANRELNSANIWQRNYYEHIIRNQPDHERIAGYILANPSNWNADDENPATAIQ